MLSSYKYNLIYKIKNTNYIVGQADNQEIFHYLIISRDQFK